MSLEGLLFTLILAAAVLFIIAAPLLIRRREQDAPGSAPGDLQRERLQTYYDRALSNLRDLDEDFALGKIEPALYEQDRAVWVERGVQALKALDLLANLHGAGGGSSGDADLDQAIEAAVKAAQRAKLNPSSEA
ncbi:MAG: hypothetical protein L6Q98_01855 [Anaerolineae bacterium]|nr:hypothetical protein [Anaerolineae bacterium]NUQ05896.1 hypothetical protein [Anaerolineae bacterium]